MNRALSIEEYVAAENQKKRAEHFQVFDFPSGDGKIYISNVFELGASELLHYHDEPHLTFILKGGVLDKRKRMEKARLSGELMFFNSEESHQTINKIFPIRYLTLTFNPDFLRRQEITEARLDTLTAQNPLSKFHLLKIYKEFLVKDEFSDSAVEMLLTGLTDEKKNVKSSIPVWIDKIHQILNDNWNKDISLDDLSFAANVHPKTVSRIFPRIFGCTLGEYRRQLKVERSLALIKSAKLTLTEIAHECNFADQSHFTRTFKDLTGFLPKEFQKI